VPQRAEILIHSPAIPETNIERQTAVGYGMPTASYVDVLGQLTRGSTAIAIAGTHGKSSTTAMLGEVISSAGHSPTVLCGAESLRRGTSGIAGSGPLMVVEACEFRRHFLGLKPQVACLLGLEPDHFDCFPDLDSSIAAYSEFAQSVPQDGTLIYRGDCPATVKAIENVVSRRVSFSLDSPDTDWQGVQIERDGTGSRFRLRHGETLSREIRFPLPGKHNVLNAVAAAACADTVGLTLEEIASGLEKCSGLKRRLEFKRVWKNALIYDDYAHHPTEIRATLSTIREMYPDRMVHAVFQSHQVSRTQALLDDFAAALSLADRAYLLPIFAARENAGEEHVNVAQNLRQKVTVPTVWISTLDQVWGTLQTDATTPSVILTLGAGNLTRVHHDPTE
ncbi:MAG TPA: Mur ligase family protein, partial [Planctomicrobium sp.]|nr:Mur ligase family protein [Planctomicrobium sp.]